MNEKPDFRTRLIADLFHDDWAEGPAAAAALRAAGCARRRRARQRLLVTVGSVAGMAAVLLLTLVHPGSRPARVHAASPTAPASAYQVISDDELLADVSDRPLLSRCAGRTAPAKSWFWTTRIPDRQRPAWGRFARGRRASSCTWARRTLSARDSMKSLIIAEKPSVAADLARALGKVPKKGDHFENDDYVISSAVGHIVELQMPEDIDKKKYGFWRLDALPIIPEKFQLKPIEDSKERFDLLKKLLARKDIELVINACDAGREGELIFTYIYQLTKSKLPVKRAWMQTMTQEGIREAFRNLREGEKMRGLADAARCRSESDWLIGINGTRALTKRMFGSRAGNVASVGRVQTPTLAIVYARELEIRNFKPRAYWQITAEFQVAKGTYEGVYQRPDFKKSDTDEHDRIDRIWDKAKAEAVSPACRACPEAVVTEEKKASTQASPRLYDLTTLQREANNRFGLSARRTSQIAQALYERHKMITYPRTDSPGPPRGLHPDLQAGAAQPPGRPGGAREQGARGAVARAEQAHLQQRPDLGPLRDHPDRRDAQAPRGHGGEDLRHDRAAIRRGLLSLGRVRHHDPHQHGRRPRIQDGGQGPHVPRLAGCLRQDRRSRTRRRTPRRFPRSTPRTAPRPGRRSSTRSSTRSPPGPRRATRRRRFSRRWRARASSSRTRSSPRP